MIFGHEGGVRAGKSYEAVLYHILPAIKAGRHVFVRLNGVAENVAAIAAHLDMPEEDVAALVHPMGDAAVRDWLVCDTADDGSLSFPHIPAQSLVVVDEAHEYWPIGRAGLPDRTGNFFAKHGHISLDIVVITQDVKELHRSIVRRMTKKNFYAKLDSLGKDQSYSVRFYSSPLPGKFELIGSEKRDYDPKVWALYHGVQPGVEGNAVYKSNTRNLWQTIKKPAIFMAAALVLGLVFIARFFMGGWAVESAEGTAAVVEEQTVAPDTSGVYQVPSQPVAVVPPPVVEETPKPVGIAHVLDIKKRGRPRYLGDLNGQHLVEFRPETGHVLERLTDAQLRALGWEVEVTAYGLLATYESESLVFTAWPVDPPGRLSDASLRAIGAEGPPVTVTGGQPMASGAGVATASGFGSADQPVARYGAFRGQQTGPEGGYEVQGW